MNAAASKTIDSRKQRWRDLFAGRLRHAILVHCPLGLGDRPLPRPDNVPQRIDYAWRFYQAMLEQLSWLDHDRVPYLYPYTGTEIFAEAFGCEVYYPPDNMPHARPVVFSAAEAQRLKTPDLEVPALARLFEIGDELVRRAGPGAVMRLPDIQSPMDIAALIWEKGDFYMAMIDAPQAVLELAHKVRDLLTRFLDAWYARYGRGFVAHWPEYYLDYGLTLSEDEVGAVSPDMFQQLFLPELVELSRRYGQMGIHCCAASAHVWEGFKKIPGVPVWNLRRELADPAYDSFAACGLQNHGDHENLDRCRALIDAHPNTRFFFELTVSDRAAAEKLAGDLARLTGR